jgi:DNA modification methylase
LIRLKDSAGPVVQTGTAAGTSTEANGNTTNQFLNLSTENQSLKNNSIIPIKDIIIKQERYRKEFGDIDTLADNISNLGLLQPIVITENNELIDGQRRIFAYQKLGRQEIPCFKVDLEKIVLGEFSANTLRKDWTYSEIVAIKRAIEPYERKKAKERMLSGKPSVNLTKGRSIDSVGKIVGASRNTIKKAEEIVTAAEQNPEKYQIYVDEMDSGKPIHNVHKKMIIDIKREKLIKSIPDIELPKNCDLRLGDFREKAKDIPDNSVHLIFTDPPYSTDSIHIYSELASLANRVLKLGGSIVTYIGQHNLPQILDIFTSNNLKYWWPIAVKHTGATKAFHQRKVFVLWKPLLWFIKGDKISESYPLTASNDYLYDYVESKPTEKLLHPWEQSPIEAEHVIKKLTIENQVVLDPLMGSGTTGIAALNLKRRFIGIEKDQDKFIIAEARLTNHILNNNTTSANIDLISDATKVKEVINDTISSFDEQNNFDRR